MTPPLGAGAIVYDITVPFSAFVPTWPTHPPTRVEPMSRIAEGRPSNVSQLAISTHAGTHVDANWHFIDDGRKLLDIPLDRWNGPCFVARIPDDVRRIEPAHLEAANIPPGTERLLLRTANSGEWADWGGDAPLAFREDYVGVGRDAAQWLVDRGVRLVGIDYLSVGPYGDENRATHRTLLGNDVLVLETIDLSNVEPGPYVLTCLPLKVAIGDGAPARALLTPR
ncbi:MAG TPA: cyclase family protein [Thermomicrobiales bacterium]|nr:cyclase family protein [Thermomicrobiales bacterium]